MLPGLTLAVVLLVLAALLCAAAVWVMAGSLLRPPRMSDAKAVWVLKRLSPGDLGMKFEEVTFAVRDERSGRPLRVAAWWVPHPAPRGRCVVLVHGYADAKVGAIAWAPTWQSLGFHVLAIDLRAHGESGGEDSTAGYFERHDVEQVINQIRAARPDETQRVVLFGVSMGAAVAAATAAGRDDLAGVVLDSPFTDFRAAATAHMELLGLPGPMFQRAAVRLAERLSGADFAAVRPVDLIPKIACPVMVISPARDVFLPPGHAAALKEAVKSRPPGRGPGVYWPVEGAGHLMAVVADPEAYRRRLEAFLQEALQAPREAAAAVERGKENGEPRRTRTGE